MHHHQVCPHCRSVRDGIHEPARERFVIRCRSCRCRWDIQGTLLFFAAGCPLRTGVHRRPQPSTRERASESPERQGSLWSPRAAPQEAQERPSAA